MVLLPNETPTQKQFRLDMEFANIDVRLYSGRGMGRPTYGVYCHPDVVSEQSVRSATKISLQQDFMMGNGTVLYPIEVV